MIKKTANLFKVKKENEAIKDKIIRDIKSLFEQQEEHYYKPVRVLIFGIIIILKMKEVVIEIKTYH